MRHRRFTHYFRRTTPAARAFAAIVACGLPPLLHAQTATVPTLGAPTIAPYRLPAIALVQPQDGGAVYQDRPVVILRFTQGEATDPLDASSFSIEVDGSNQTKLFQTSSSEAWGPLARVASGDPPLAAGVHHISARICSSRGVCAMAQATVSVIRAATFVAAGAPAAGRTLHQRLLDAALNAARRILIP